MHEKNMCFTVPSVTFIIIRTWYSTYLHVLCVCVCVCVLHQHKTEKMKISRNFFKKCVRKIVVGVLAVSGPE